MKLLALILALVPAACVAQKEMKHRIVEAPMVHDPVMIKQDNTYYLYSTGWNISCMSSTDLKKWRFEKPVFNAPPMWAMDSVNGYKGHTWAPDVIYHNGRYHMFYSCSTFGKNTSAIGHAVTTSLHPGDSARWEDTGAIITSRPGLSYNAIDPAVIIDQQGKPWMTFGSFWGGIQLVELSSDLTSLASGAACKTICTRQGAVINYHGIPKDNAVEAPFLFYHEGYYYLFVSFDFCCRGLKSSYKVMVGRSKSIQGPYLDKQGVDMAQGGGSLLLASTPQYIALGHCAVYHYDGKDYFLAHGYSRSEDGASKLLLTTMEWDAQGWPQLSNIENK